MVDEKSPPAANMVARGELVLLVTAEIKERAWTQQQAAEFFGVTQPRISDLMTGRIEKFTVDTLMNWVELLGKDVSISVRPNVFNISEAMKFTLFVVGDDNIRVLTEINGLIGGDSRKHEIEVVNVLNDPERARAERISATPCLVREFPLPKLMLVGDFTRPSVRWQLSNAERSARDNRENAADLRQANLDQREKTIQKREDNHEDMRETSTIKQESSKRDRKR